MKMLSEERKEKNSNEDHVYRYPKNRNEHTEQTSTYLLFAWLRLLLAQPDFPLDAIIKFRITQIRFYFFRNIFRQSRQQHNRGNVDQFG